MPSPILLAGFAGSNTALDAYALPETVGVDAVDLDPGRDRFVPLKARVTRTTVPSGRLSIYRLGRDVASAENYWLSSPSVLNYARMFGADSTERTIITGSGSPKWTNTTIGLTGGPPYPQAMRELSVPAPVNAPTLTEVTAGDGDEFETFVVQTFVNDLGWESAPSTPSTGLVVKPGAVIDITGLGSPPAGNYGITSRRIYVTQPGTSSNSEFYFLREVTAATTSTQDDGRARGALLATYDGTSGSAWLAPPTDGFGVLALWNGMHALLSPGKLHLCVPNAPYAWPTKHDKALKSAGVALGKWGQNLAVLTTAEPMIYQGLDPLGMAPLPAPLAHPCLSARGVVSFATGVAWPSSDGLAWIGDTGQAILTEGIITPEQWRDLDPAAMIAGRWRDCYVCALSDGRGFMLDMKRQQFIWLSKGFDACHYDEISQALFVLEGTEVREFAAGEGMEGRFTSKRFLQTHPANFGYAKVVASSYPVKLTITSRWNDDNGVEQSVEEARLARGPNAFSLRSGFLAESVQIEVRSSVPVTSVRLATTAGRLKGL